MCCWTTNLPQKYSTLMRYAFPQNTNLNETPCPQEQMSKKAILKSIKDAKTDSIFLQSKQETVYSKDNIERVEIQIAKMSRGIDTITKNLIETCQQHGKALEIGSGIGLNSLALFKKGWSIDVLDKHKEVLDIFKIYKDLLANTDSTESKQAPEGECKIINKDITKTSLKPHDFDLIMAYDVLAYLPPETLIPTLKKIYEAVINGGLFVGTFLVKKELKTEEEIIKMSKAQELHSYSYTNPAFVANVLRHVGFLIENCTLSNPFSDSEHPGRIVTFVARKITK